MRFCLTLQGPDGLTLCRVHDVQRFAPALYLYSNESNPGSKGRRKPEMNVGNVCHRHVVIILAGAGLTAAAQLMREEHVGFLVVVEPPRRRTD
jgi:hypothetical protein